ncbi:MAG TPA: NUDIX hydrolase [Armatimonadota bacterium]|nr:NUDIX hydrolase [Armatimonadota bacterium]
MPYTFCPNCGSGLAIRTIDGKDRRACPQCEFVDYENPRPCVGVLVIDRGKVLLVARAIEPFKGYWDIPGGFLDSDEHPADAAKREMMEETGLLVEPVEVLDFWVDVYGEETFHTLNICYLARLAGGEAKAGSDATRVEWFPLDALPPNIAFNWERQALEKLRDRLRS